MSKTSYRSTSIYFSAQERIDFASSLKNNRTEDLKINHFDMYNAFIKVGFVSFFLDIIKGKKFNLDIREVLTNQIVADIEINNRNYYNIYFGKPFLKMLERGTQSLEIE